MAVILLALDESGKLDNTEDVVFGGCMFENSESHRFGERWNKRLDESKIYSLHMKDAMRLGGNFRGWKDPDRDTLPRELLLFIVQVLFFQLLAVRSISIWR